MKRSKLLLIVLLLLPLASMAQVNFFKGSWADVMKEAKRQDKLVFVDIYTTWCGPCRQMQKEVFPDREVGEYMNANFINYSVDAEKGEGKDIAKKYNAMSYPLRLFVNGDGEVVFSFNGGVQSKMLMVLGQQALNGRKLLPRINELEKEYANGRRDTAFLHNMSDTMFKLGKSPGHAFRDYFDMVPDSVFFNDHNISHISALGTIDEEAYSRIKKALLATAGAKNASIRQYLESAAMSFLGNKISRYLKNPDKMFIDSLEASIKEIESIGAEPSIQKALNGGGAAYFPIAVIRMDFYSKADNEKYLHVVENYINDILADKEKHPVYPMAMRACQKYWEKSGKTEASRQKALGWLKALRDKKPDLLDGKYKQLVAEIEKG